MPSTLRTRDTLLKSVGRCADVLGISRHRLIARAQEQVINERSTWTPGFLGRLRSVDADTAATVDGFIGAVTHGRRSKRPRDL